MGIRLHAMPMGIGLVTALTVMVGLVPTIHVLLPSQRDTTVKRLALPSASQDVDGRHKADHDGRGLSSAALAVAVPLFHPVAMKRKRGWVYMMTNQPNGTLYIGVTSDLSRRVYEHREALCEGFTRRYGLKRLVWYEWYDEIENAIQRETSMKRWYRAYKTRAIAQHNPDWQDLYEELA